MPDPVVIDDGGSTRIKQLVANVDMDEFLREKGSRADGVFGNPGAPRATLTVVHIERDGTTPPIAPVILGADSTVEIVSLNNQKVTLTLGRNRRLDLELASTAANGADPIVEAKQHGNQRRYVVANAGLIQQVFHTPDGGARTLVFDATATAQDTIYTMVHIV